MANWCSTSYAFYNNGNTENFNRFKNAMIKIYKENMFNDTDLWLGKVAEHFGLYINGNSFPYGLRGWITFVEDRGDHLRVDVQDAWYYHNGIFEMILDNDFSGVDYVMCAEEPGCEVYVNTDTKHRFFKDKYVVYTEDNTVYFEDDRMLGDYIEWCRDTNQEFAFYEFKTDYEIS